MVVRRSSCPELSPVARPARNPLRRFTADERQELTRLSRWLSAPAVASRARPERCWLLRMARLHGCRPPGRTTAQREDLRLGQPLQTRRARRSAARPWADHGSAMALMRSNAFGPNGRARPSVRAGRHGDLVVEPLQRALRRLLTDLPRVQDVHELAAPCMRAA